MTPTQFRRILEHHKISQMELSRSFAMSPRAIRRWACGERAIPPLVVKVMRLIEHDPDLLKSIKAAA